VAVPELLSPVITSDHEVLGIQISVDLGTTIMAGLVPGADRLTG
jgi:hypothetical protein